MFAACNALSFLSFFSLSFSTSSSSSSNDSFLACLPAPRAQEARKEKRPKGLNQPGQTGSEGWRGKIREEETHFLQMNPHFFASLSFLSGLKFKKACVRGLATESADAFAVAECPALFFYQSPVWCC